ncbi:MAG: type II toxin-antitoxin system RelE/ParE family toxin [Gammaproteobacteria bacterium]|nr:MAG: type II toxin-antitoxin system RelE/ParE family toxin [Gammaproteobacteria bacterium]
MTRRIVRTRRADEDLIAIWQSIAAEDLAAADRILDAIDARCQQLPRHPFSGPAKEDIGRGMRHLVAGHYMILYRIESEIICVVRVLHDRRRLRIDG